MLPPTAVVSIKNYLWSLHEWFPALLLLPALLSGCTPSGPRNALDGQRLIQQGRYAEAVIRLHTASSILATNAQVWNWYGLACHYAGQANEAERAYQRALKLDNDLAEARFNLGCLWLSQNRTEPAKSALMAYTLRRGNTPESLLKLGQALLQGREWGAAEKTFGEALRLRAENPQALNGLGVAAFRQQRNRATEAAQYFSRALKQRGDYRPALLNMAIVSQENLNAHQQALQLYRQYLALKPPPEEAQALKALCQLLEDELKPPAISSVTTTAVVTPTRPPQSASVPATSNAPPQSTNRLSPVPHSSSSVPVTNLVPASPIRTSPPALTQPPAQFAHTAVVQPDPILKPAHDIPATTTQSPPTASHTAEAPRPSNPTSTPAAAVPNQPAKRSFLQRINPLNLFHGQSKSAAQTTPLPKGEAGSPKGEAGGAKKELASAPHPSALAPPASDPASRTSSIAHPTSLSVPRYTYLSPPKPSPGDRTAAQALFDQGTQAQGAHRLAEAIQAYRKATELDPGYYEAYFNLGLAAAEAGDQAGALTAYENALAIRPESLDARYNFALALKQANYFVDTANELNTILLHFPGEPRANLVLGNLYAQQLPDPAKARQCYLKVLESDPHHPQADSIRQWLAAHPL